MENYSKEKVVEYFRDKAETYDLSEQQTYWQLSDALLWLKFEETLKNLPDNFSFFDAGGGTGRWTMMILEKYPKCQGTIFDLSEDMLQQARRKIEKSKFSQRVKVIQGNLCSLDEVMLSHKFDLSLNFHNVLGFVEDPALVIKNLAGLTKPQGIVISFVPNLYHNIFFNLLMGNLQFALDAITTNKGRFTTTMPPMHLFTPESISELYTNCSIEPIEILGFPATIYPGFQETQSQGSTKRIEDLIGSPDNFNMILKIEQALMHRDTASRGNNIYISGRVK